MRYKFHKFRVSDKIPLYILFEENNNFIFQQRQFYGHELFSKRVVEANCLKEKGEKVKILYDAPNMFICPC